MPALSRRLKSPPVSADNPPVNAPKIHAPSAMRFCFAGFVPRAAVIYYGVAAVHYENAVVDNQNAAVYYGVPAVDNENAVIDNQNAAVDYGGAGQAEGTGILQEIGTMADDFMPRGKTQLQAWLANFNTVASANMATLGLTTADITALNGTTGGFTSSVAVVKTAKANLKAATQGELGATKTVNATVRGIVRRIQSNAAVAPALKASLGINPRTAVKNHAPPVTPTGLTAEGFRTGVNRLNWNRTGNKPNTIFVVQAQIGASAEWVEVGSKNATKFDHIGQTPGVKVAYRVLATRADMASVPSPSVTLYSVTTTVTLTLAKAA